MLGASEMLARPDEWEDHAERLGTGRQQLERDSSAQSDSIRPLQRLPLSFSERLLLALLVIRCFAKIWSLSELSGHRATRTEPDA
jgi:hypothetical protein